MTPPLRLNRIRTHIPELAAESDLPSVKKLWTVEKRLGSWDDVTQKFFSNHVRPRGRLDGHGPRGWIGDPPCSSLFLHTDNRENVRPYKKKAPTFLSSAFPGFRVSWTRSRRTWPCDSTSSARANLSTWVRDDPQDGPVIFAIRSGRMQPRTAAGCNARQNGCGLEILDKVVT